jgi:hypothetical protein
MGSDIIVIDANGLALVEEDYQKIPEFYNSLSALRTMRFIYSCPTFHITAIWKQH